MGIIIAFTKNKKGKIRAVGKTLNLLSILVFTSKFLAERIAKEKDMNSEDAEKFIIECITDGMDTIKM